MLTNIHGILFDIDGTLCDSDPLHYEAFKETLIRAGYDNGRPITEAFFKSHISGRHNRDLTADLFPSWDESDRANFSDDKENIYRDLVKTRRLQPLEGLLEFVSLIESKGIRKAAVTNAPRCNAELMLAVIGVPFDVVVVGDECARAKPFPDPYLEGMRLLDLEPASTLAFEDSPAGIKVSPS